MRHFDRFARPTAVSGQEQNRRAAGGFRLGAGDEEDLLALAAEMTLFLPAFSSAAWAGGIEQSSAASSADLPRILMGSPCRAVP